MYIFLVGGKDGVVNAYGQTIKNIAIGIFCIAGAINRTYAPQDYLK